MLRSKVAAITIGTLGLVSLPQYHAAMSKVPTRVARLRLCGALLLVLSAAVGEAWGQGAGSTVATPVIGPTSWWNRTVMRSGSASPSRFYAVRSDLPEAETRELARRLDLMHAEYQKRLAGLEQRVPGQLNVFMFARERDYLDTLRSQFGADVAGSGGVFFITPRGAGLAFFSEGVPRSRLHHVIQHEGFHQVANTRFGTDLPQWVDEGLAEFFGEAVVVGSEVIIGQSGARTIKAIQDAIEAGTTIPFLDMVTMSQEAWNRRVQAGDATLQYQQAWSMVHFLVYGEGGKYRGAFERYLRFLNNGASSADAFGRAFGTTDLAAFEQRWKAYALAAKPGATVTAAERLRFLAEGLQALLAEGQRPQDFAELRRLLTEKRFSISLDHHGHKVSLTAEDPSIFDIPDDEHSKVPPVFELVPFKGRGLSLREKRIEDANPTPPCIVTSGLRPRELQVRWRRLEGSGRFEYDIVAR
jgi:hypothetical protein